MAEFTNGEYQQDIFGFLGGGETDEFQSAGGDSNSNEVGAQIFSGPSKDAVIFCIDCANIANLMDDSHSESRYQSALKALHSFMRNKVIASDGSDMTGLVFYNVTNGDNPLKQRGINLVQPLSGLSARRIKEVNHVRSLSESEFVSKFGPSTNDTDISELLFVCNAQFKKTSASYRPRMFIFTASDDPCGSDRKARKAAITRANDFHEGMSNGAEINLIPLSADFDVMKFWERIVLVSAPETSLEGGEEDVSRQFVNNAIIQLSELNEISLKKLFKKRPLNRINVYLLDSSVKLAMMMYTSYLSAGKPRHIYLDPASLKPLKSETRYISDFTGAVLDPHLGAGDIKTYIEYQGRQVPMSKEEVLEIKKIERESDSKGVTGALHVIGFKPLDSLRPELCVGHSCFLYPQESRIAGSSLLVSALIDRLADRGLIAIARAVPKANAAIQFVALVPQQEVIDPESGRQEKSPGFFLLRLPFADDVRDLTLAQTNVAASMAGHPEMDATRRAQVACAKGVVARMTEPYWEPDMLDNPALKVCYTVLEALALGTNVSEVDEVQDLLHPDPAKVEAAEQIVPDWLQSMSLADTTACTSTTAGVSRVGGRGSMADYPQMGRIWTEATVEAAIQANELERLTVGDLKGIISQVDRYKVLTSHGRKADLIHRIQQRYIDGTQ